MSVAVHSLLDENDQPTNEAIRLIRDHNVIVACDIMTDDMHVVFGAQVIHSALETGAGDDVRVMEVDLDFESHEKFRLIELVESLNPLIVPRRRPLT